MARYEARPWRHLYRTAAWRHLRAAQIAAKPLCEWCLRDGVVNDGSLLPGGDPQPAPKLRVLIVDHKIPHKGDHALFHDPGNLQTLCKPHHDRHKQREEIRGYSEARGLDGWPIDPAHPANRA